MTVSPLATDAETRAMANGLASTLPCPIMLAACSVRSSVAGTDPSKVRTPMSCGTKPSDAAALVSSWALMSRAWPTKAVLHDLAKSVRNGTLPSTRPLARTRPVSVS